jgi:SAM-dependent methyltransferase
MEVVRFDIRLVEGWPFEATDEAKAEYGSHTAHPILDRYFEASAPVRWFYWRKFELIARLDDFGGGGGTALVAGCGPGIELPTLATGFKEVIALDINDEDLEIARAICRTQGLANVTVMQADLLEEPLAPESVDTVFMIDVLEHFPDAGRALESVNTMLADGGKLVVAAPTENRFNDWLRRAMGYRKPSSHYHTSRELERELRRRFRLLKKIRPLRLPRFASLVEIFLLAKNGYG